MEINGEYFGTILKRLHDSINEKITLISGKDNQRFSIHRILLTKASKYFATLFDANFQKTNNIELILDDADGETIQMVVNYCGTGKTNLTVENVDKVMAISLDFELDLLQENCRQFYIDNLSVAKAIELLNDQNCNIVEMRERALKIACESFESLPLAEMRKMDHRLFEKLLDCDTVNATEEMIFARLYDWFEHSTGEREKHMPKLLKLIRLQHIPSQLLNTIVDEACAKFDCSELIYSEDMRRAKRKCEIIGERRFGSVFSLYLQDKGLNPKAVKYSAVKIEKFSTALDHLERVSEIRLGDRTLFRAILHDNKIYVLGGMLNNHYVQSVSSFDLNTCEEESLPEMGTPRVDFTAVLCGKHIYVFGGWNSSGPTIECERFDTESNTWEAVKSFGSLRSDPATFVRNDHIFLAGGWDTANNPINSVDLYDTSSDQWIRLPAMSRNRCLFSLVEASGFLYAMGNHESIEKYDPWSRRWTEIGSFDDSDLLIDAINIHGQIYAIMENGKFGHIKFNKNSMCSFVPLCESKIQAKYGTYLLFHNN